MSVYKSLSWLGISLLAIRLLRAETPASPTPASPSPTIATSTSANDLDELRKHIAQQEEQIRRLQQAIEEQRTLLEKAVAVTNTSAGHASNSSAATDEVSTVAVANKAGGDTSVPIVPAINVAHPRWAASGRAGQKLQAENPSPLGISIGTTTFTPLGFVDFTWYGRSTNVGSGVGTNFGGIPYNTSFTAHLSENNFTAQNSRIGFRVDSKVLGSKVLGYFEADFYGNQGANVFVSNGAATFRMRNVFVDVQKGRWEILGGQDWSMLTPNRKGLSPIPSDIFYTQNMDLNYQAGLIWARQSQFRLVFHPNNDWAMGMSLENPQQYAGGSGGSAATSVVFPSTLASVLVPQFNDASAANGAATGAGNYSTPNLHPDIIFKGAYDGHMGKDQIMHLEAGALIRSFKDTIPVGTPVTYRSNTATSVSGTVNANLEIVKNVHLIANTFFGQGGGRYIFGLAPDIIVRADGTISPLHSYSTVDGIEANVTKNTLIDAYYGGVYIGRQIALDANGRTPIGYGTATAGVNDNRTIQEYTLGLTQTLWKSANYGALAIVNQYPYLTRNPWTVAAGAPKSTHTNLYYIDLRYTLP
jgi:hypothetical protein